MGRQGCVTGGQTASPATRSRKTDRHRGTFAAFFLRKYTTSLQLFAAKPPSIYQHRPPATGPGPFTSFISFQHYPFVRLSTVQTYLQPTYDEQNVTLGPCLMTITFLVCEKTPFRNELTDGIVPNFPFLLFSSFHYRVQLNNLR